jgi:hypothetical protein
MLAPMMRDAVVRTTCQARVERVHIATERASDYLDKLCRHIQRIAQSHPDGQLQVERSPLQATASFGWGRCTVQATPEALTLHAEAGDEESLRRLEGLIASRLETFGKGERLTVTWSNRPSAASTTA